MFALQHELPRDAALDDAEADERAALRSEARDHAWACLEAIGNWTVETLGAKVASAFGLDLGDDECEDIAREAIAAHYATSDQARDDEFEEAAAQEAADEFAEREEEARAAHYAMVDADPREGRRLALAIAGDYAAIDALDAADDSDDYGPFIATGAAS